MKLTVGVPKGRFIEPHDPEIFQKHELFIIFVRRVYRT
jgi:hypothetical protein